MREIVVIDTDRISGADIYKGAVELWLSNPGMSKVKAFQMSGFGLRLGKHPRWQYQHFHDALGKAVMRKGGTGNDEVEGP